MLKFMNTGHFLFLPPCLVVACLAKSPSGKAYAAPLDAKKPSKLDLKREDTNQEN